MLDDLRIRNDALELGYDDVALQIESAFHQDDYDTKISYLYAAIGQLPYEEDTRRAADQFRLQRQIEGTIEFLEVRKARKSAERTAEDGE